MLFPSSVGQSDSDERAAMEQAKTERVQQGAEPQTATGGAGARQGGGRNAQKSNPDRVQSSKDKVASLKSQRNQLASKTNKTPADKAAVKKLDNQIKRETQRQQKSETHSKKHKGQQQ